MFGGIIGRLKRMRRRRSMRMRPGRRARRVSWFRMYEPLIKIGALVLGAAALVLVIIFVIAPLFGGDSGEPVETVSATPTPRPTPIARDDMSDLNEDLTIDYKSINDPFVFGRDVVFSTGDKNEESPEIKQIAIFNMDTQTTTVVDGITASYAMLFEPKMNEDYIVYLDCKSEYGGAVCGFDRVTGEKFVMREYLYGKPKVYLSGEYALWLQQTGKGTDRLYLYHLPTREVVEIEVFVNTEFFTSATMSDEGIVYVQPKDEHKVPEGSVATSEQEICVIPLTSGGDMQRTFFVPGGTVYNPMLESGYIVYADGYGDESTRLMLCAPTGDTYAAPTMLAENVVNYAVGDGYVAYTKDEAVYVYFFADGSTGRLTPETTRALLASANGKDIVWYDITELGGGHVVFHAQMP